MTPTWRSDDMPNVVAAPLLRRAIAVLRGTALLSVLLSGSVLTLLVRVVERLCHGQQRPWSGWITVCVCRLSLKLFGLKVVTHGSPIVGPGAFVANHSSWLDIFVLNAGAPLVFVSKAEVSGWPGIGWLARLTNTVFVERNARAAEVQKEVLEARMRGGDRLLFFPEGTSTDGQRILRFKPTLFAALFSEATPEVQPVSVSYVAPKGFDPRFYGWWGDMAFAPHLWQVLAAPPGGQVTVHWHAPLEVAKFADRKSLAAAAENAVRSSHSASKGV